MSPSTKTQKKINGPEHLTLVRDKMVEWMEENSYTSVRQMRGSMGLDRCPDPQAFERANYMRTLQSWRGMDSV